MRVNEASHLYCPLTPGRVQEVCRYYLGASAVSARLLGGGLFNTTYLLETASQRVVLRLGPVNRSRLLPYESRPDGSGGMTHEGCCKQYGIPPPPAGLRHQPILSDRDRCWSNTYRPMRWLNTGKRAYREAHQRGRQSGPAHAPHYGVGVTQSAGEAL